MSASLILQKWTIPEIWTCQREPGAPIPPQTADIPSIVPSSEVWHAACLFSCRMPTKTDPRESPSVTAGGSASRRVLIAQDDDALRASVRANQSLGQPRRYIRSSAETTPEKRRTSLNSSAMRGKAVPRWRSWCARVTT